MASDKDPNRRFGWLLAVALGATVMIVLASLSHAVANVRAFV